MQEQIKNIIAPFLKLPVEQINAATTIDRTAVGSSIILHRMYAKLANEGIAIADYWDIKDFGTLLQKVNGQSTSTSASNISAQVLLPANITTTNNDASIGIDIEQVSMMPTATDFREDEFYTMNFSAAEIAYCILQANPAASFTGLFAAKEAIVKADNSYMQQDFNAIVIDHLPGGRPVHPSFHLSISHTAAYAVAVATPIKKNQPLPQPVAAIPSPQSSVSLLSLAAFILSIVAIIIAYFHHN